MVTRLRAVRTLAVAVLLPALLLPAACAGERDPASPPATSPEQPTAGPPGFPMPTLPPTPLPPSREPTSTLSGELSAGVESGCLLLTTDRGDYLLLGDPVEDLPASGSVTVRGQVRRDLSTTCQQGTPFEVTEVLD